MIGRDGRPVEFREHEVEVSSVWWAIELADGRVLVLGVDAAVCDPATLSARLAEVGGTSIVPQAQANWIWTELKRRTWPGGWPPRR